jgi:hypothetical protein
MGATSTQRAPVEDRLDALPRQFAAMAWTDGDDAQVVAQTSRQFILDHAASLSEFALQVREEYARIRGSSPVVHNGVPSFPTAAQGLALAGLMRGRLDASGGWARASRGGGGLGDDYVYVQLHDGYEGGIDTDGRVST